MSQLLIEVDTPEDEALLMQLLPKLNSRILEKRDNPETKDNQVENKHLKDVFAKLTRSKVADKYGDPLEWQREARQDKPLTGR
ncbi:hypothetical protein [Spirosoma utsteinense]|uniref:Uncharacterized protein n=1 Tax=Spirosoma utsteinense TaxID=2585773 RepID=A0ABR6W8K7_9BACT|nr:hypothetical protein [Spirosoma utsteinense]MBC3787223.1 hypothetical protein [Spirosoma utsteinense]MBC3792909.1 hypothetical protein [Spirosoma utsteinense]